MAFSDVVQEQVRQDGTAEDIVVLYLNPKLSNQRLGLGQYEIVLRAEGGGAYHRARFTVSKPTPETRLAMRICPE